MTGDIFWTDHRQAQERLNESVVMYDGKPAYIQRVYAPGDYEEDEHVRAKVIFSGEGKTEGKRKRLDSPKWNRFRELPKLGFMYYSAGNKTLFLERITTRSRTHGLSSNNTRISTFHTIPLTGSEYGISPSGDLRFSRVVLDKGFLASSQNEFPSLNNVLLNVAENSALPYSRHFAVFRDSIGLRWLYRKTERIGFFSGADTLNLLKKTSFYKEEIMNDPLFTLNQIKEY